MIRIPNQNKYYTDGVDLYSKKSRKYRGDYFWKHTGWKLTYKYEWRFYIKKQYRGESGKNHYYRHELSTIYNLNKNSII